MTNWSKREAKYILDYLNVKYKLVGEGYVIEQTIPEETIINGEIEIELKLEKKV